MKHHRGADTDGDAIDGAMIGFLLLTSDWRKITAFRGRATSDFSVAACRKSPMSLPAVNTPERPVRIRQRIAGLDCALSIALLIARYISCVSVFFFSGRRIVIVRVESASSTMICSVMASLKILGGGLQGLPGLPRIVLLVRDRYLLECGLVSLLVHFRMIFDNPRCGPIKFDLEISGASLRRKETGQASTAIIEGRKP
jgi:hypothetical protein